MWWILVLLIPLCLLYGLMVLGFWVGLRKNSNSFEPINKVPMPISVVIPVRNEAQNIEKLLSSLSNIDYPMELFEIVMVNDNSTDQGWELAQSWMGRMKNLVLLELSQEKTGKKNALTLGISQTLHSIVVLTDADCEHPTNWLSEISNSYKQNRWCMLVGPVMISPTNGIFQKMQALEYASLIASSLGACALGFPIMASSANLAFVKKTIGFNHQMLEPRQTSGDDVFLLHNAKRNKCNTVRYSYSVENLVTTKPVGSVKEFFFQRARWASKAPAYKDFPTILIALVVLLFNLMIAILLIGSIIYSPLWLFLFFALTLKIIVDLPLLRTFLKNFKQTSLLSFYIPLQLIYPLYIVVAFMISLIMPVVWKERKG